MSEVAVKNLENDPSSSSQSLQGNNKKKKNKDKTASKTHSAPRKTLHELQVNSLNNQSTNRTIKDFVVYQDKDLKNKNTAKKSEFIDRSMQCESPNLINAESQTRLEGKSMDAAEAEAFMYQETEDELYWKELADKRLEALNESLNENESLHIENADLHYQVEVLKESLKEAEGIVDKVKKFAFKKSFDSKDEERSDSKDGESSDSKSGESSDSKNGESSDSKDGESSVSEDSKKDE